MEKDEIKKMIEDARISVCDGGWDIDDIIDQYKEDGNVEMLALRLAFYIKIELKDLSMTIAEEDDKLEAYLTKRLREHRHLEDGQVVIPL